MPECVRMDFEKLVAWTFATPGTGVDAIFFQGDFHGFPGDALDAELPEFAENSGVAPAVFAGQFQHQLPDVIQRSGTTGSPFR